MNAPRYTIHPGRVLCRDGVPVATIHRVGSDATGYALGPAEADALARKIARALNVYEKQRADARRESKP